MYKFVKTNCISNRKSLSLFIRLESNNSTDKTIQFIKTNVSNLRTSADIDLLPAALNWDYILNKDNFNTIGLNIKNRKGNADIKLVVTIFNNRFKYKRDF